MANTDPHLGEGNKKGGRGVGVVVITQHLLEYYALKYGVLIADSAKLLWVIHGIMISYSAVNLVLGKFSSATVHSVWAG